VLVVSVVGQYRDRQFVLVENVQQHRMSHVLYDILEEIRKEKYFHNDLITNNYFLL